jgi:hypothetical protein
METVNGSVLVNITPPDFASGDDSCQIFPVKFQRAFSSL